MAGDAIVKDQERKQGKAAETIGELQKEILHKLENTRALHEALAEKARAMHAKALGTPQPLGRRRLAGTWPLSCPEGQLRCTARAIALAFVAIASSSFP